MKKTLVYLILISICSPKLFSYTNAFVGFNNDFAPSKTKTIMVSNLPKIRSQDSIGVCYAFSAATLLNHKICKEKKIANCSELKEENAVSVLDLARMGHLEPDKDPTIKASYTKIVEGGHPYTSLYNSLMVGSAAKETCSPFCSAVNKYGDSDELQKATWDSLKIKYAKVKDGEENCIDCVVLEIQSFFPNLKDKDAIKKALNQTDYESFLYRLLIPSQCIRNENRTEVSGELELFPTELPTTLNEINNSILDRLKGNTPVSLSGICLDEVEVVKDFKSCQNRHSVVITGYTEMCNKKNKCYRAFKVHNSWGEDWQKENSDGWVLADELLKKTSLEQGAITYIK